ncbi:MAG: ABC transporter permease [Lachnospiraceae bacterium]
MSIINAMIGAVSQGVLWAVMSLGVYITFRLLNIADLSVDGTFALGGVVTAVLIMKGWNPVLALLIALLAGMVAGAITGLLHTKLGIPAILAGILTMISCYSINLRIADGAANTPLLKVETLMQKLQKVVSGLSKTNASLVIGIILTLLVVCLLYWFFGTELGSALRATGNNEKMVRALGVNTDTMKIFGLLLSNGLVALSGGVVAQSQSYADVQMGTGTIVVGLASIVIGEVIFGSRFNFFYVLMSVVFGSIIYRIIIAIVLQLGMRSSDLKLLTAIIVALALSIPKMKSAFNFKKNKR